MTGPTGRRPLDTPPTRRRAYRLGLGAETRAAWYLRFHGWRILAQRYRTPVGEIDLVARRGKIVAFIEVKARRDTAAALEAVTPRSQQRITRAAHWFVSQHPKAGFCTLRFDIIVVRPWHWPQHIANAFEAQP